MKNPWGLTDAELRAALAVIECGSHKHAARVLGLSAKTIDAHMRSTRDRMAPVLPNRGRLTYLIYIDRWAQRHLEKTA